MDLWFARVASSLQAPDVLPALPADVTRTIVLPYLLPAGPAHAWLFAPPAAMLGCTEEDPHAPVHLDDTDWTLACWVCPTTSHYGMICARDHCGDPAAQFRWEIYPSGKVGLATHDTHMQVRAPPRL